jgi:hypothetical protein
MSSIASPTMLQNGGAAGTVLHFTHEGLVPEKECYPLCHEGWNTVIKDYLFYLITDDKPHF